MRKSSCGIPVGFGFCLLAVSVLASCGQSESSRSRPDAAGGGDADVVNPPEALDAEIDSGPEKGVSPVGQGEGVVTRDLAGAPAFGKAPTCESSEADHVLRGDDLRQALERASRGELRAGIDHTSLIGSCDVTRRDVAEALRSGGFKRHKGREYRSAASLLAQSLHADPSHTKARYDFACALALSQRPVAAVTHLEELARAGEEGRRWLALATRDSDLDTLRERERYLELFYPENELEGEREALAPTGPVIPLEGLPPPSKRLPYERREPLALECSPRPRCIWPRINKLLIATEEINADGKRRAFNRRDPDDYQTRRRIPFPAKNDGYTELTTPAYWHAAEDARFVVVPYRFLGAKAAPNGIAIYSVEEGGVRFVYGFEAGTEPCADGETRVEAIYSNHSGEELRIVEGCGKVVDYRRLRWESERLNLYQGRIQLVPDARRFEPDPETAPADVGPARDDLEEGEIPGWTPARTCRPAIGSKILGADAVRGHLKSIVAGVVPVDVTTAKLMESCSIEPVEIAKAYNKAGLTRYREGELDAARGLFAEALRAEPLHLASRFNLAGALSRLDRASDSVSQLAELAKAPTSEAGPWFRKSVDDPDFRNARQHEGYAALVYRPIVDSYQAYGVGMSVWNARDRVLTFTVPGLPSGAAWEVIENPWRDVQSLVMSSYHGTSSPPSDYSGGPGGRYNLPPEALTLGYRPIGRPAIWTPAPEFQYLVVPFHDSGFPYGNGVAVFAIADEGVRFLGGTMATAGEGCHGLHETAEIFATSGYEELRLVSGCGRDGGMSRIRHEAGELRLISTQLALPRDD